MRVNFHAHGRQSAQGRWLGVLLLTALLCGLGAPPLHAQTAGAQSDAAPIISEGELLRQVKAFVGQQVVNDQFSGAILIAKDGEVLY